MSGVRTWGSRASRRDPNTRKDPLAEVGQTSFAVRTVMIPDHPSRQVPQARPDMVRTTRLPHLMETIPHHHLTESILLRRPTVITLLHHRMASLLTESLLMESLLTTRSLTTAHLTITRQTSPCMS